MVDLGSKNEKMGGKVFVLNAAAPPHSNKHLGGLDLCAVCEDGRGFRLSLPPPPRVDVSVLFSIEEAGAMGVIDFSTLPGSVYFQTTEPPFVSGSQGNDVASTSVVSSSWASRWGTYTFSHCFCI